MEFINERGTYDCEKFKNPELYTAFEGQFEEQIDVPLCKMMIEDTTIVPITVKEPKLDIDGSIMQDADGNIIFETKPFIDDGVEQTVPLFSLESKREMKKIIDNISNGSINEVHYSAKRGGVGRRYCEVGGNYNQQPNPSLTTISRNMRNTLYHYQGWKDFDFVASHPTALSIIAKKLNILTPRLDEWIEDKEPIINKLSKHHSVEGCPPLQKDHIKKMICMTLYGGGIIRWAEEIRSGDVKKNEAPMKVQKVADGLDSLKDWREIRANHTHPYFNELKAECKVINECLWKNNPEFRKLVCDKSKTESEKKNQFTSYYLGVIENHCLYYAYNYFVDKDIIDSRKCSLAYDGFTAKCKNDNTDFNFHLQACNQYILENTGFPMKLIDKEFDKSTIQLPIINMRRNLPTAEIAPALMEVQAEAMASDEINMMANDAVVAEQYDQEYLIWRNNFEKNHCKIIDISKFIKTTFKHNEITGSLEHDGFAFMTKKNLEDSYGNLSYKKGKKRIFYIKEWFVDNNMKSYERCDAIPHTLHCPTNVFNTWKKSSFYGQDITDESPLWRQEAIDLFTSQMDILCDHNSEAAVYVMRWLAQFIQQPHIKTTHICITSAQGTGKSLTFNIYKKIVHGGSYETTSPEDHLWGKFNAPLLDNTFIIISEANKSNGFGAGGKIKGLITDPDLTINPKGKGTINIQSYHRFITLTNHPNPIVLEEGDRRNLVIKSSPEMCNNREYFNNYATKFDDPNYLLTLYSYFNNLDIDDFEFKLDPDRPLTEYQHNLKKEHSRNPLDDFFEWWVSRQVSKDFVIKVGDNEGCVLATGGSMLTDFKSYKEQYGGRYEVSGAGDLVTKLKLHLSLPKDAIRFHKKSNHGNYNIYDINILKKHYRIAISPRVSGGGYMGGLCNEESQEVLIGGKDSSDDDVDFAPRDGRRSSSLLNMRISSPSAIDMGSLTNSLQEIENEIVTAEVVTERSVLYVNEEDDAEEDDAEEDDAEMTSMRMEMRMEKAQQEGQMPLDSYDHHAKNGDIEDEEEEDEMGQDSDYEQEGQPDDCDSDEEEDTKEIAGVLKDSSGRSIILKKRQNKY